MWFLLGLLLTAAPAFATWEDFFICPFQPDTGCTWSADPDEATLRITPNRLRFQWRDVRAPVADYAHPSLPIPRFTVCVYDAAGLEREWALPTDAECVEAEGAPCWLVRGGYTYRDADEHFSILLIQNRIAFSAVPGFNMLPLADPVRVQLRITHPDREPCWDISFPMGSHRATLYRARSQ